MKDKFYNEIYSLNGVKILKDVDIRNYNNLKIISKFKYQIDITSLDSLKKVFKIIDKHKKKYFILGNGSNVLFFKKYYKRVLIRLNINKSKYSFIVNANDSISFLNSKLIKNGIESLNFLTGVPCSVGGAIYMNAGAFSKSMKDIVEYVYVFDLKTYKFRVLSNSECNFSYRDSYFKHHNVIILGAKIKLIYNDVTKINKDYINYLKIRKSKLPLDYPNLGSIFKNPSNNYAGKLIEDSNLKGLRINDAMVSYKHANVIVNVNQAKGKEILKLIKMIRKKVYKKFKIKLELEIIILK